MFDEFWWMDLYSVGERKNNSEPALAEFDLCLHHQSISMAGLNPLSPKLKQTEPLLRQSCWCAALCSIPKTRSHRYPVVSKWRGTERGSGRQPAKWRSQIKWPVQYYCGNYHKRAAVQSRGGNSRCVCVRGNHFYHTIILLRIPRCSHECSLFFFFNQLLQGKNSLFWHLRFKIP